LLCIMYNARIICAVVTAGFVPLGVPIEFSVGLQSILCLRDCVDWQASQPAVRGIARTHSPWQLSAVAEFLPRPLLWHEHRLSHLCERIHPWQQMRLRCPTTYVSLALPRRPSLGRSASSVLRAQSLAVFYSAARNRLVQVNSSG